MSAKASRVLALIPARSGSKSIVDKNVRDVAGKPLIAWSIEHALAAKRVDRVIVSTDSEAYAALARECGAEVPFLRPAEISGDAATDLEAFAHALAWLKENEGYVPDICVHLRPTCPVRDVSDIDAIVDILATHEDLDSVRTVTPVLHPPYKMWTRSEDGSLSPVAQVDGVKEPWNEPRQKLPESFIQTANIDAVRTSVILEQQSMTGTRIHGYMDAGFHDIDEEHELQAVASTLKQVPLTPSAYPDDGDRKTFCFDVDGVIAEIAEGNDYSQSAPIASTVEVIQQLHAKGHRIVLHTARGYVTGIDWRDVTERQMNTWGVPFDTLTFGKPAADYYIDDRMLDLNDIGQFLDT